jgi:hypothetical protein
MKFTKNQINQFTGFIQCDICKKPMYRGDFYYQCFDFRKKLNYSINHFTCENCFPILSDNPEIYGYPYTKKQGVKI